MVEVEFPQVLKPVFIFGEDKKGKPLLDLPGTLIIHQLYKPIGDLRLRPGTGYKKKENRSHSQEKDAGLFPWIAKK
jgi:hypothetical protein